MDYLKILSEIRDLSKEKRAWITNGEVIELINDLKSKEDLIRHYKLIVDQMITVMEKEYLSVKHFAGTFQEYKNNLDRNLNFLQRMVKDK